MYIAVVILIFNISVLNKQLSNKAINSRLSLVTCQFNIKNCPLKNCILWPFSWSFYSSIILNKFCSPVSIILNNKKVHLLHASN